MLPTSTSTDKSDNKQSADGKSASTTAAMVSSEFYNFVADIEDLVKASQLLTGEELAKAKLALNKRITAAKLSIDGVSHSISQKASKTAEITNSYVHEKPWPVVAAVSVAGFLLGYILARRN